MNEESQMIPFDEKTTMPAVKLGTSKAAIGKLRVKYAVVPDAAIAAGYEEIKGALRELVPIRTGIEAKRKELVAGAVAWQKAVNSDARELTELMEEIEKPFKDARAAQDEADLNRRLEAERIESDRVARLEAKVAGIRALAEGLLNAPVATLEMRMAQAEAVIINSDEFGDYLEPGLIVLAQVKSQLNAAVVTAKQLAEMKEQMAAQKKLLDESNAREALTLAVEARRLAAQELANQVATDRNNAVAARAKKAAEEDAVKVEVPIFEAIKLVADFPCVHRAGTGAPMPIIAEAAITAPALSVMPEEQAFVESTVHFENLNLLMNRLNPNQYEIAKYFFNAGFLAGKAS